jgi:hypothetical protein
MHMEMGDMLGMVAASIFSLSMVTIMPELPSEQVICRERNNARYLLVQNM